MSFTGKSLKDVYKDVLQTDNSNSGLSTTIKQIKCGDGDATALYLSTQNVKMQPASDSTTNTVINDKDGNALVAVDSTNDLVKAGIGQHTVNTQYAHFGIGSSVSAGFVANRHFAIPFEGCLPQSVFLGGTGTDPDTSFTLSDEADDAVCCFWYVMDDITIDRIIWWSGADAATGDTTRTHLMSYTVDSGNSATSGDLSSGAVVAYSSDVTNAGYEQAYYNQMTISTADIDAGKVLMFFFRGDSINSDYAINATVKYHLR
jgi:hypothetical protein